MDYAKTIVRLTFVPGMYTRKMLKIIDAKPWRIPTAPQNGTKKPSPNVAGHFQSSENK
jgi:hypothetical protein